MANMKTNVDLSKKEATLAEDIQSLAADIKQFGIDSNAMHDKLKVICARCVIVAVVHGQTTPANDLIEVMKDKSYRLNHLRDWFIKRGPFIWKDKSLKFDKNKRDALLTQYNKNKMKFASVLTQNPFWKDKKEAEYKPVNAIEGFEQFIKKMDKSLENEAVSHHKDTDTSGLDAMKRLLRSLKDAKKHSIGIDAEVAAFNAAVENTATHQPAAA
mgnify:CR=1 FL=1